MDNFCKNWEVICYNILIKSLSRQGEDMQEKESEVVKWIKELQERKQKLDMQIEELDRETVRIKWRMT